MKAKFTLLLAVLLCVLTVSAGSMRNAAADENTLTADFTTDKSFVTYYEQGFDTDEAMADWTVGSGWAFIEMKYSSIDSNDKRSAVIGYSGSGSTTLLSPELTVEPKSNVEFYAYFQAVYLVWGSWQLNVIDVETGEKVELFDAFDWAQANAYTGPAWNKYSLSLAEFSGRKVQFELFYNFGGEDLVFDGFRLVKEDASCADEIHVFETENIQFMNTSVGQPDKVEWTFEGGSPATSTENNPVVTYNDAGTYDVTLVVTRGTEVKEIKRPGFVVVSKNAPAARIGLPEEGYESPFIGVFIPTNVPVTFRDMSVGKPTQWDWIFQNTDITSSNEQNPTVTYLDKGVFSVGLTVKNDAGESSDMLTYAIQAGGAQYVWNIGFEENQNIEKVALGWYGNYAGSNWLGMERFAEIYKAPLADATVDSVAVYFASNTTVTPDADIEMTINSVADNGQPGDILATTSIKASELRCDADSVVPTIFHFEEPVEIAEGQQFYVVVGPFPHNTLEESPYTADDIAIFCVRRGEGGRCTTWHYLEDQNEYGESLGTYTWFKNTDDPLSLAIAPVVTYDAPVPTGIVNAGTENEDGVTVTSIYNICGQKVQSVVEDGIYILKYSDGTTRKVRLGEK